MVQHHNRHKRVAAASGAALAAAALVALHTAPAEAQSRELRYAYGRAPTTAPFDQLVEFADELTAAGIPTKVYPLSLTKLSETSNGVRDGLADIGWIVIPYNPAEYSEAILISNLSVLAGGGPAASAAMNGATLEYTLLNCPECIAQFVAQNQVYLVGSASPPYALGCTSRIETAEDLAGKRLRAGAGYYRRWAEAFGATPVSMSGDETFEALSQGVIDCTTQAVADIYGSSYLEVIDSITTGVPGAPYSSLGAANMNIGVWRGLSGERRAAVLKASARLSATTVVAFGALDAVGLEEAKKAKVEIVTPAPALLEASAVFAEKDIAAVEAEMRDKYGVQDVAAKIATARALIEKWTALTEGLGDDAEALEKLYWDEVYSKLDPATYAMN